MTCKVYFVFIYKWQLFYYQIKKIIKILKRLLKFLMLCNAWLTLVNHLHFKYTHIHIYPYCVYVWVFPLYWKVMKDANASLVCLLLIRNKIFIKILYEICFFAWLIWTCHHSQIYNINIKQSRMFSRPLYSPRSFGTAEVFWRNNNICFIFYEWTMTENESSFLFTYPE